MSHALAYFAGRLIPQDQALLPLYDAGFVMGATVTDMSRTVRHRLFRWPEHLQRFRQGCRTAAIDLPLDDEDISRLAFELVANNAMLLPADGDLALVLFATPGPIGFYAGLEGGVGNAPPTFGMHTFPLPFARYRRLFREGAHLAVPKVRQVSAESVDPRIKQRSRLHWWLADREIHAIYPGANAVLLNEHDNLTETASANLLIVKAGIVYSPPRDTILGGISLLTTEEICRDLAIPFAERPLAVSDAENADEILLTSTPWCMCGASRFNDKEIRWPGPVYQRLLAGWSERIGLDIHQQIESRM